MKDTRIRDLPPLGRLFVGIFATLMLFVGLWATVAFYMERGLVSGEEIAVFDSESITQEEIQADISGLSEDSLAVLAPIWDTDFAGREAHVDSATMAQLFPDRNLDHAPAVSTTSEDLAFDEDPLARLAHNVELAHKHIISQTFIFFGLGLIFLFSSVAPSKKKIVLWVLGTSIVLHSICLTGEGFHWLFDTVLVVSAVIILLTVVYMTVRIYVDLVGQRGSEK